MLINYEPKRINIKGYVKHDCTVNAIGSALGISYDLARKLLQTGIYKEKGEIDFYESKPRTKLQFSQRFNVVQICEAISEDKNMFITEEERKQKLRNSRYSKGLGTKENCVGRFAETNPKGVFILLVKGHLLAVVNGNVIDTWDSSKLAVEVAYRVDIKKARNIIANMAKFYRMNGKEHYVDNIKEIKALSTN